MERLIMIDGMVDCSLCLHVIRAGHSLPRDWKVPRASQCALVDTTSDRSTMSTMQAPARTRARLGSKWSVFDSARKPHTALKPATLNSARR